jgi:hypothetical protein
LKTKKEIEVEIFRKVYPELTSFEHTDKPDFICSYNQIKFGVEVTQLFINESDARLSFIPNYSHSLLEGPNYKHRKDKLHLKTGKVKIINEKGVELLFTNGIIQKLPNAVGFRKILYSCLSVKNKSTLDYTKSLFHYNLIINDNCHLFSRSAKTNLIELLFDESIILELAKSPFNEVFFVTMIEHAEFCIRLRRLLILSRIFQLSAVFEQNGIFQNELDEFVQAIVEFLSLQGFHVHYEDNSSNFVIGDNLYSISIDKQLEVDQYPDGSLSKKYPLFSSIELLPAELYKKLISDLEPMNFEINGIEEYI